MLTDWESHLCESTGFETPGPDYWPADEVGEEHTFGLAKIYNYETCGPGMTMCV